MSNKPTFKEYIFINRDYVIKSSDGHYYFQKKRCHLMIKIAALFLIYVLLSFGVNKLFSSYNLWENVRLDILLLIELIAYFVLRLQYRRSTFENVDDTFDDPTIFATQPKTLTKNKFIFSMIFCFVITMFVLLNSFSAMFIRSLFEKPHNITDMRVNFTVTDNVKSIEISDCENLTVLSIPDKKVNSIVIHVNISGSPSSYQFKLNGVLMPEIDCTKLNSYIWDEEVFKQFCRGSYDIENLPDNSVLEISSGSFSRQWTIKTE